LKLVRILKRPIVEIGLTLDGIGHAALVSWSLFWAFAGEHLINIPSVGSVFDVRNNIGLDFLSF
jgi:hypothetical protein